MAKTITRTVPTLGMGQPDFTTCWWASYRMLYKYLKRNLDEIDTKLAAMKIDVADCKKNGLADTDYATAATALGLKGWAGQTFSKPPTIDLGLSDGAEAFIKELDLGPLWVSRIAESRPGKERKYHAVLAYAYDDDSGKILYNNPWSETGDAMPLKMRANDFVKLITAAACSVQGWRYKIGEG
jgi:hypothetical protein